MVNSTEAAALVRQYLKRPCTRQNLEAHARAGVLPYSTRSLKPLRFHPWFVADEFEANVGPPVIAATGGPAHRKPPGVPINPAGWNASPD